MIPQHAIVLFGCRQFSIGPFELCHVLFAFAGGSGKPSGQVVETRGEVVQFDDADLFHRRRHRGRRNLSELLHPTDQCSDRLHDSQRQTPPEECHDPYSEDPEGGQPAHQDGQRRIGFIRILANKNEPLAGLRDIGTEDDRRDADDAARFSMSVVLRLQPSRVGNGVGRIEQRPSST